MGNAQPGGGAWCAGVELSGVRGRREEMSELVCVTGTTAGDLKNCNMQPLAPRNL